MIRSLKNRNISSGGAQTLIEECAGRRKSVMYSKSCKGLDDNLKEAMSLLPDATKMITTGEVSWTLA